MPTGKFFLPPEVDYTDPTVKWSPPPSKPTKLTEDEVFTIIMDTLLDFYNNNLETTGMRGTYRIAAQRIVAKAYPIKEEENYAVDYYEWYGHDDT